MILLLRTGPAAEIRQLGQRHVHAERAGAGLEPREAPMQIRLHRAGRNEIAEQQLRGNVGSHRPSGDALAGREAHPASFAAFDDQRGDRRICADDGTARLRGTRHGLTIAPMPPTAWPHTPGLPLTSPKQWCSST